jgi:uroporphyrinogen decarboxylase
MRQAGRYLPAYRKTRARAGSFLDLCFTPDLATEVTLQPIDRFGFDAAILFSDILVIPWALGCEVRFVEGEGPVIEPIRDAYDVRKLQLEGMIERLSPVMTAVRQIKAALPVNTPLIGFAGAPWTLATYMFGGKGSTDQASTKLAAIGDPTLFRSVIDLLEAAAVELLLAQIEAGADIVKIFDSWAGAATAAMQREFVLDPIKRIVARIKQARPKTPIIFFPRGVGANLKTMDHAIAPDGLALDSSIDPLWAAQTLTGAKALQGNLDPVFMRGPISALLMEAQQLRLAMRGRPHILNLGHGVTPQSKIENIEALLGFWREMNEKG